MQIIIQATKLKLTPSIEIHTKNKLGTLAKFIQKFDETGQAGIWVEIGRTTRHHRHGEVYMAEADLRLPGKILRAVEYDEDIRAAIDKLRTALRHEIEKYRTKRELKPRREGRSRKG